MRGIFRPRRSQYTLDQLLSIYTWGQGVSQTQDLDGPSSPDDRLAGDISSIVV